MDKDTKIKKKLKIGFIVSFSLSLACLIIGASFHYFRLHPEDESNYKLGVNMGISMISLFAFFLVLGIILLIVFLKKKKE